MAARRGLRALPLRWLDLARNPHHRRIVKFRTAAVSKTSRSVCKLESGLEISNGKPFVDAAAGLRHSRGDSQSYLNKSAIPISYRDGNHPAYRNRSYMRYACPARIEDRMLVAHRLARRLYRLLD